MNSRATSSQRGGGSDESDLPLILWILPVILAAATPGLVWAIAARPLPARMSFAAHMTIALLALAALLTAVLSRGFTTRLRWSLSISTMTVLTVFQWPALTFVGRRVAAVLSFPLLADLVPVLMMVGALAVAARNGGEWQFAALTTALTALMVGGLLITALGTWVRGSATERGEAAPGAPDVLLLVLDGYVRSDVLESDFGFDNSPFERDLSERGFIIPSKARANYNITHAALATMLDLDYVFDEGRISDEEISTMRRALGGEPALLRHFRRAGYDIAYTENLWEGSYCGRAVDLCWRDGVAERVLWNLAETSIFAPVTSDLRPHPFNTISESHLAALPKLVAAGRRDGVPRLTIAHIILPHPPYLLDAACDRLPIDDRRSILPWADSTENRRSHYTAQLACTNQMVLESLDAILAARPDTLVMISGDHGSNTAVREAMSVNDWPEDWLRERLRIFSAYRAPGCSAQIGPAITPVNGARMLTNCALGSSLDWLPDRHFAVPDDYGGYVLNAGSVLDG